MDSRGELIKTWKIALYISGRHNSRSGRMPGSLSLIAILHRSHPGRVNKNGRPRYCTRFRVVRVIDLALVDVPRTLSIGQYLVSIVMTTIRICEESEARLMIKDGSFKEYVQGWSDRFPQKQKLQTIKGLHDKHGLGLKDAMLGAYKITFGPF